MTKQAPECKAGRRGARGKDRGIQKERKREKGKEGERNGGRERGNINHLDTITFS